MANRTQNRIEERAFAFLRMNDRGLKPRTHGITEIRGPYYSPLGKKHMQDVLETMGNYVDALKFAGGSFSLMPRKILVELISLCHEHNVPVSTGGFIEHVLTQGPEAVNRYIEECKELGFDIIEISSGFITLPADDWLRLVERVQKTGLKAKPEVGIQFGAGGATKVEELEAEGTRDPEWPILLAKRFLGAGVPSPNTDRCWFLLLSKKTAASLAGNILVTSNPSEWLGLSANAFFVVGIPRLFTRGL